MANRILRAAAKTLGRRWTDFASDIPRYLKIGVQLQLDPVTQLPIPSLEIGARDDTLAVQQERLGGVLDTLDAMAARRGATLGVVLDEFQEIARFGRAGAALSGASSASRKRGRLSARGPLRSARHDQPEWHLRGVIQQHQHLSYVLAGSRRTLGLVHARATSCAWQENAWTMRSLVATRATTPSFAPGWCHARWWMLGSCFR
jgi:hypothetical protein